VRTPGVWLALVMAAGACDCGGGGGPAPAFWIGEAGAARILAVSAAGEILGVAAAAPALDSPVRSLAPREDGAVVVVQEVLSGAPPVVLLGRDGSRLAAFDRADAVGTPLFDPGEPPWAAAEAADGRIWVTGRPAPVLFEPDGRLAGSAAPLPFATRGIAALPDGRVLVTYGASAAAVYAPGGGTAEPLAVAIGAAYSGLDALAVRADGTILAAVLRHGVTTDGVVVEADLVPGGLVARGDPEASARLPGLPSALVPGEDGVVAGPGLGELAPAGCAEVLSADLRRRMGCLAPGAHRGVARLP
jgi:hypothetical protein